MSPDFITLRLRVGDLVDLERLGKVLQASCPIVHKVCDLQTCFIFSLFLIESYLEVAESKLLVQVELCQS